jgi:diguanylate cyclase (GGDEF)-like protein
LTDFAYILALDSIAFGALWKTHKNQPQYDLEKVTNVGARTKWVYLLIYPAAAILLYVTGIVEIDLDFRDIATFLVLTLFYMWFSKYYQLSVENTRLLDNEKRNNEILEQRVAEQVRELTFLANQDTLTTLYNRRYFLHCLDESIKSKRQNESLALLLFDLDRFKIINDNYGHDVGDRILIELSGRLVEWNNRGATIARLGGDEFVILLVGKYSRKYIESVCEEIIKNCSKPFTIDGRILEVSISMGVALYSPDAADGKALMKNADISMYRAKSQGYNKYQFYDPLFSYEMSRNAKLEALLKRADVEKDFELYYQPQFSLPSLELIGAEALLRWKNQEHGYIPPDVFIPVAERIDYIYKLGKWVIKETIRQAAIWNNYRSISIQIGFNISPKQLNDDRFIDDMRNIIAETEINTNWLDAEITESIMISDKERVEIVFRMLKALGISISIDDFGSGYSALGYLNEYPFDRIKIDKSLIDNISSYNTSGTSIVRAAITMAKAVSIKTIAEGVETPEQLEMLIELGCDQAQGYLLGRPVPADIFEQRFIRLQE